MTHNIPIGWGFFVLIWVGVLWCKHIDLELNFRANFLEKYDLSYVCCTVNEPLLFMKFDPFPQIFCIILKNSAYGKLMGIEKLSYR